MDTQATRTSSNNAQTGPQKSRHDVRFHHFQFSVYATRPRSMDFRPAPHRSGITLAVLRNPDGTCDVGVAACMPLDQFCRRTGRKISRDRLLRGRTNKGGEPILGFTASVPSTLLRNFILSLRRLQTRTYADVWSPPGFDEVRDTLERLSHPSADAYRTPTSLSDAPDRPQPHA